MMWCLQFKIILANCASTSSNVEIYLGIDDFNKKEDALKRAKEELVKIIAGKDIELSGLQLAWINPEPL